MQGVMELYLCHEMEIYNPCHVLPEDLIQHDSAEVTTPFWGKDGGLAGALTRKVTLIEIHMYQANDHLKLKGVRRLLPSSSLQPFPEML